MRLQVVLLLLVPACTANAQDVKLEAKYGAVGDKGEVRLSSELNLDIVVKDSEGERTIQLDQRKTERFTQEVIAIADGLGQTLKVTCAQSEVQSSGTNKAMQTETTALQGKSYLVKRTATGTTVEATDGSPVPAGAESLGGWEGFAQLLPSAKAASVGDEWTITNQDVSALVSVANMAETRTAKLACALKGVDGAKATLGFKGEIEGKTRDGAQIKVTVSDGEMVFDTGKGRPLSIRIAGSLEATKDIVNMYIKPGTATKIPEKVGEIRTKSRKLEAKISFQ